jgi:CRISPR type III-B/RAMP module-associated protein Cmr5
MSDNIVSIALAYTLRLKDLVDHCREKLPISPEEKKKMGAGIARRAKDLPSLIASAGLVPALTFYMSKSKKDNYMTICNILSGNNDTSIKEANCKDLEEELSSKEKAGYSTLLAVAACGLRHLGLIGRENDVASLEGLAAALKKLLDSGEPHRILAAEKAMTDYLIEVKKLAEAFFKTDEEGG